MLPENFLQEYQRIQQELLQVIPDIELANSRIPHITLYYLGSQIVDNFEEIMRKVSAHTELLRGEHLRLSGFDYFRHHDPRVVFVQVEHSPRVEQFYRIMKEELSSYRNEEESRDFHAHMTVGKLKGESAQQAFLKEYDRIMHIGNSVDWVFDIEKITLFGVDSLRTDEGQSVILSEDF